MRRIYTAQARVRYAETDASGIVYYANYFIYFEVGRLQMFRELDLPYDHHLPIRDTYCRYHASARFEDLLQISTTVQEVRRRGFRLGHQVHRLDPGAEPRLLVQGYTVMVTADEQGRPAPLPPAFEAALGPPATE